MATRRIVWVLAMGLLLGDRRVVLAAPPVAPAAPADQVLAALRTDLIGVIERDAAAAQNKCASARAQVSAIRDATGDVARRLRERLLAQVLPALTSGQPDCLVDAAARLVPFLPDTKQRAVIAGVTHLFENGLGAWGLYRDVMPTIARYTTPSEARLLARAVPASKGPSCWRAIILAHLADVDRAPPADAFAAMKASRDQHCLEGAELAVLRFADEPTLRTLFPSEMALLDAPPATFALEHVRALALMAPYLDAHRRPALLAAAFRAMPKIYVERTGGHNDWGELPPEFHFQMAMMRLGPLVDAGLVDAALAAIPPSWPAGARGFEAAQLAAVLPAPLRRARLRDFLAAIPDARADKQAAGARLVLAADLPPDDVRAALEIVIKDQTLAGTRARAIAGVFHALPASSLTSYAARLRTDVAAAPSADARIADAASALDALDGQRR